MSNSAHMEWEKEVLLDDLINDEQITLGRGNIISKIDIRNNPGPHPIYSSSAKNNGKMGEYGDFMFDEELISWSVDGGGNFFYRPKHKFSVTNVSGYLKINCPDNWSYRFLHYSLDYQHSYISFDYQSKAHPSVIRDIYNIPVIPLPEQKKIASILTSVDEVIEKTESQIAKLQDLKTGMMQELLTKGIGPGGVPHTEFKDSPVGRIPVGWGVVKVSDVVNVIDSLHQTPSFSPSGYPMARVTDIKTGKLSLANANLVSREVYEEFIKKYRPKMGDVVMSRVGSYGVCSYVNTGEEFCIGQNTVVINPHDINSRFLYYSLNCQSTQTQIEYEVAGSGYKSLSLASIRALSLSIPSLPEQERIGSILWEMDNDIEKKSQKSDHLRSLKKALMQDLLTGKVRVKTD